MAGVTTQSKEAETALAATGWSLKKTPMGKNIHNEAGDKVGKVEDLIIDTQRNVSHIVTARAEWAGRAGPAGLLVGMSVALLGGCASLLPSSREEVVSAWSSYEDAVKSLAALEPFKSTRADAHAQGLDPYRDPSIRLLHFGEVMQRFAAAALIKPEDVDRGISRCLQAGKRCIAYAISVRKTARQRVGNFWLDSLDFKRETHTTGWSVEVLLVFVDELMVYELIGGQPRILEEEVRRNPLGPLQGLGEQAVPKLR